MEEPNEGDALVGFGIATAVRDVALSVAAALGLLYLFPVFPVLSRVISIPGWRRLQGHTAPLGVLAVCAATALLVSCLLLRLRDA
jgi:hypothetical protein